MVNSAAADGDRSAMNLSEKTVSLAGEASAWIAGNIVDVLLAAAAGIVIALLMLGIRSIAARMVAGTETGSHWRTIFAQAIARTGLFFIIMSAAELVAEHAQTPPPILRAIHVLFVIAASFQAAVWAREIILGFVAHRAGEDDAHKTLGTAIGLIRVLVTVALFAIAVILILANLGVDVTGLVAGLGIGGIAIGLAAQGIFSDLFAALSIIFDKPFRRGETIRFDTITGTVEQTGLKTTRLRSLEGEQIIISNTNLLNKQIQNFANLEHRRFALRFGVTYQTAPDMLDRIPDIAGEIVRGHRQATFVRCGLTAFGASSLDFELQFDVHTSDYEYAFSTRHAVVVELLRAFAEAGIEFAYPTQTSFTAAPDGTLVMPYPHVRMIAEPDPEE